MDKNLGQRPPKSFWEADFGPYQPAPPLAGELDVDVAIIGGGFTGLTVAREVMVDSPGARVAVLEARYVGFGASGRNGGFSMTLFGMEPELTRWRWGEARTRAAALYMERAVAFVRAVVSRHKLDVDYRHSGMLRVAYSARQAKRLEGTLALLENYGSRGRYHWREAPELARRFGTQRYRAAIHEPDTAILNPIKHVRALKRLAVDVGARVYEETPVTGVTRTPAGIMLSTPGGSVRCQRLVIAVNAWSRRLQGVKRLRASQVPVWTYQIVTEPIAQERWDEIGWRDHESFEDNRQLVHYFRRTACGRITMGGGDVVAPFGDGMAHDEAPRIWRHLVRHLHWLYPQLRDIGIAFRWGGPVSANFDMTPEIGFIGDERVIYANGCIGHGVSLTQLNGRLIADLVQDKKTELSDFWIVNRRAIPWPPEPFSFPAKQAVRGILRAIDWFEERGLDKAPDRPGAP
ncbi:MAG: NAD(P)/FAD-dependent oxidoreductase [Pseudomonadota bacterium]